MENQELQEVNGKRTNWIKGTLLAVGGVIVGAIATSLLTRGRNEDEDDVEEFVYSDSVEESTNE